MYPDQYQIIFMTCLISVSVLVLFLHWRWKVRQRNRLAERHRDSAVIRLRTKSFQGFGCFFCTNPESGRRESGYVPLSMAVEICGLCETGDAQHGGPRGLARTNRVP